MQLYDLRRYRISTLETKERFFQSLYNILSSIFSMKDRRSHQAWITLRGRCHAPPDTFYTDQILHHAPSLLSLFSFPLNFLWIWTNRERFVNRKIEHDGNEKGMNERNETTKDYYKRERKSSKRKRKERKTEIKVQTKEKKERKQEKKRWKIIRRKGERGPMKRSK